MNLPRYESEPSPDGPIGESFDVLPRYLCYLDYLRKGESPPEDEPSQPLASPPLTPSPPIDDVLPAPADVLPAPADLHPEPPQGEDFIEVRSLASSLPDPARSFWWFSSEPVPEMKLPAGRATFAERGSRLPPEADYWSHEGAASWVKIDRTVRPKPAPKPKRPTKRKVRHYH